MTKRFMLLGCFCMTALFSVPSYAQGTGSSSVILAQETQADTGPEKGNESQEAEEAVGVRDPLEPWNRAVYAFNDKFYFWVAKPVAQGYSAVVLQAARVAVKNFFHNLTMPIRFAGSLLQWKVQRAGIELARFGVNSTLGVVGFSDVAKKRFGLETHDEDLSQTLGFYGIGNGFYIVWPFIGPSSLRDTFGWVGDNFLTPVNYISSAGIVFAVRAYDYENHVSLHIGDYEDLKKAAVDPYIAIKDAYIQHMNSEGPALRFQLLADSKDEIFVCSGLQDGAELGPVVID